MMMEENTRLSEAHKWVCLEYLEGSNGRHGQRVCVSCAVTQDGYNWMGQSVALDLDVYQFPTRAQPSSSLLPIGSFFFLFRFI